VESEAYEGKDYGGGRVLESLQSGVAPEEETSQCVQCSRMHDERWRLHEGWT
jgi:hypothetical protein